MEDTTPTASRHQDPRGICVPDRSVPYWNRWISPDHLPCRDVKPTRPVPCRNRDSVPEDRTPRIKKRKSSSVKAEESKKSRKSSQGRQKPVASVTKPQNTEESERRRERCYEPEQPKEMTRSLSPCYRLPAKPVSKSKPCKPLSPRSLPKPCVKETVPDVDERSELGEEVDYEPEDCSPKRPPCTASTPQGDPDSSSPDVTGKSIPCQRPQTEYDVAKPCRQRPHKRRVHKESKTTKACETLTETPCKPCADTLTATVAEMPSSEIQKVKPCRHARTPEVTPHVPSAERQSKDQPATDENSKSKCRKTKCTDILPQGHYLATDYSQAEQEHDILPKKCNQVSEPPVVVTETSPEPDSVPVQRTMEKPCDKVKTSRKLEPIVPCGRNTVEEARQSGRHCRQRVKRQSTVKEDTEKSCKCPERATRTEEVKKSSLTEAVVSRQPIREVPCKKKIAVQPDNDVEITSHPTKEQTAFADQTPLTAEESSVRVKTTADCLKISETIITEKPCKNKERTSRADREGAEVKRDSLAEATGTTPPPRSFVRDLPCGQESGKIIAEELLTEEKGTDNVAVKTKQRKSYVIREVPCKENTAQKSGKIMARQQSVKERDIKTISTKECSKTEKATSRAGIPCRKTASVQPDETAEEKTGLNTPTEFDKHQSDIDKKKPCREKKMQQEPLDITTAKQKPCQSETEGQVPVFSDKTTAASKKPCYELKPVETTAEELASCTEKEDNSSRLNTQQERREVQKQQSPCSGNITDGVIALLERSSSTSGSQQTSEEPGLTGSEVEANRVVAEVIQAAVQQAAELSDESETQKAGEENKMSAFAPKSGTDRCGCTDVETADKPLKSKQDEPIVPDSKENAAESYSKESGVKELTSTVQEPGMLLEKLKQDLPSRTVDGCKGMAVPNEKQVDASEKPCPKLRTLPSNQSVESTSRLIGRCRQDRILKMFKAGKKLPCQSKFLEPDSSGSTMLSFSYQPSSVDLSDYESDVTSQTGSYQDTAMPTQEPSSSQNIQSPLAASGVDLPAKVETTTPVLERADTYVIYGTEATTKTPEHEQSATTDPNEIRTRKAQSDDHDVVTHRQSLSSEVITHTSAPSMDALDFEAQPVHTEAAKSNIKRKDSGWQPSGTHKPVTIPRTVTEDVQTLLELDSFEDSNSDILSKTTKTAKNQNQNSHAVEDSRVSASEAKVEEDVGVMKSAAAPDQPQDDPYTSDDWDSSEKEDSGTPSRPTDTGHGADQKTRQHTDNKNNSCDRKPSDDELADSDWSDDSSHGRLDLAKPKRITSKSKKDFVRKSSTAEAAKFRTHVNRTTQNAGSADKEARYPVNGPHSSTDDFETWEDLIASLKLSETN